MSFDEEPYALPGATVVLAATLQNPLPGKSTFQLEWTAPDGQEQNDEVTVPAGGVRTAKFELTMPVSKPDEPTPQVKLRYVVAGTPWNGTLDLALNAAGTLISAESMESRAPDFTLQTQDHIYNANENDPNRAEWAWKGPSDLSAKVWLGLDDDALLVRVDVSDERHRQPNGAGAMWQADSIQIGIRVPGRDGNWELGLARHDDGSSLTHGWQAPSGLDTSYARTIELTTAPRDGGLVYSARLPLAGLGVDTEFLCRKPIGVNLIVNDKDGDNREGFAFVAPGLGRGTQVEGWPLVTFEDSGHPE